MSSASGIGQIPVVTVCAGSEWTHLTSPVPVSTPRAVMFTSEKPERIGGDGEENGTGLSVTDMLCHADAFQGLAGGF